MFILINKILSYQKLTIPSLQDTLAKHTWPTLQPNFVKEPLHPSRSNAGHRDSANLIDKQIENKTASA